MHLCKEMHQLGFENSEADPCLFIHKTEKIMVLNYCDDQIWLSPDNALIERYVATLENIGYDLSIEDKGDNMFGFLGIETKRKGSSIELTQTGLINKVISYCGMDNRTTPPTPAAADPLGSDLTGKPFSEEWSYPAVVGMLLYLASNTRPDIQFAVHQVASPLLPLSQEIPCASHQAHYPLSHWNKRTRHHLQPRYQRGTQLLLVCRCRFRWTMGS
jgi:hypothetical protein